MTEQTTKPLPEGFSLPLGVVDLQKLLPHRYPFLLVDRIIALEPGVSGVGIRNVTVNEPQFAGHFPGVPIYPGVLLIETCGQVAGIVHALAQREAAQGGLGYLASVDRFKFLAKVQPGDQLVVSARLGKTMGGLLMAQVEAAVGRTPVAKGSLTISVPTG